MSNTDPDRSVDEAEERYSEVDAEDVVDDAKDLFEQHHEGPPLAGNPEADIP